MKEKLLYFHNVVLPLLTFIIHLSMIKMYGFTIKGLINTIVIIYSAYVIYSFDKHIENIKK